MFGGGLIMRKRKLKKKLSLNKLIALVFLCAAAVILIKQQGEINYYNKKISKLKSDIKTEEKLSKELETIALSVSEYVNKNASETLSQDEYINEYTKLTKKYEKKAKQRERLISEKEDKFRRADEIRRYVQKMIETQNLVTEWDDTLWVIFLDSAIVNTDGTIEFGFKDGSKISV